MPQKSNINIITDDFDFCMVNEPSWTSTLTRNCFNLQKTPSTNKREIPLSMGGAVCNKSTYCTKWDLGGINVKAREPF
jgi:hypothetical protein